MPAKAPVVRLKPSTYRYLQRRARETGKSIGHLVDEAIRPRKHMQADDVLERIADMLDDHYVAQNMQTADTREWTSMQDIEKELKSARKPRKARHG